MKKVILQFLVFVLLFMTGWGLFSLVDWKSHMNREVRGDQLEEKLGSIIREAVQAREDVVIDNEILGPVDSLLTHICKKNEIDRDRIQLVIIDRDEINAFALPGGHLGIFTGLIKEAENEAELAGVLAHEVAHISLNHVMDKMIKELGFSVLVSIATGNATGETIGSAIRIITSNAYSRSLEEEADQYAAEYLISANINPESYSEFLYRMSRNKSELPEQLKWLETHPDPEARAMHILELIPDNEKAYHSVLGQKTWENLQNRIKNSTD